MRLWSCAFGFRDFWLEGLGVSRIGGSPSVCIPDGTFFECNLCAMKRSHSSKNSHVAKEDPLKPVIKNLRLLKVAEEVINGAASQNIASRRKIPRGAAYSPPLRV